jgi:antitoxin component HigA of HigAB toxin-antitoxin module
MAFNDYDLILNQNEYANYYELLDNYFKNQKESNKINLFKKQIEDLYNTNKNSMENKKLNSEKINKISNS